MRDWAPTEPLDIVTVAASASSSSATMLATWVPNATLFGVGGLVASLQAIIATPAATAVRFRGNTRIGWVWGDGVANVYPSSIWCKRKGASRLKKGLNPLVGASLEPPRGR